MPCRGGAGGNWRRCNMPQKSCYGGTQFEVYGKVVDLQQHGSRVEFRLEPVSVPEAAMMDGNDIVLATILICHKLIRTSRGMVNEAEVFFANRNWKYVCDTTFLIRDGDKVRIFIDNDEIDKVRDSQMDGNVEIPLADVFKA